MTFDVIAFANTCAIIDGLLHPLFHLWTWISPTSYEWVMGLFVAGLQVQVTDFDSRLAHVVLGTILEACSFWLLGAFVASVYNRLVAKRQMRANKFPWRLA